MDFDSILDLRDAAAFLHQRDPAAHIRCTWETDYGDQLYQAKLVEFVYQRQTFTEDNWYRLLSAVIA